MIKAHPTTYGGVNFRSRLEAKWAAFFDLLDWTWQYEPIDLNGWTPDFSIQCHSGPIYVEVKPIEWSGCPDDNTKQVRARADLDKVRRYIVTASNPREVLILGTAPAFLTAGPKGGWEWGDYCLGLLDGLYEHEGKRYAFEDPALMHFSPKTGYDFRACYGSFHFRLSGEYDGDHHLHDADIDPEEVKALWREASNTVQWNSRALA